MGFTLSTLIYCIIFDNIPYFARLLQIYTGTEEETANRGQVWTRVVTSYHFSIRGEAEGVALEDDSLKGCDGND